MIGRKPDSQYRITNELNWFPPSPTVTAVFAMIIVLLMLATPGPIITAIKNLFSMPVMPPSESEFPVDKVIHFVMFAVCGWLSARAWAGRFKLALIGLMMLVFAAVTEILQVVIPGRSGDVSDFLADALGVAMGVWWWGRIKKTRLAKAGF